ncbi:MAG: universal stress protein [Armatimonadetes bacterium]|nr:universal stress protein [Armatimonadota bacterium]
MLNRILCAYDGSAPAEKAFAFAVELAERFEAELLVLSVARPPEPPELVETAAVLDSARAFYAEQFERLRAQEAARTVRLRFDVAVGHPAEQIVHRAEAEGSDLIVVGHRGKSLLARWLLGSVSKRVLSYAPCAVLVVR